MVNNQKYLFLDNISQILWKSRSFCQKEVSNWRLIGEKKYILWKRKFVIQKEDFLTYVKNNPERVGNITNIQENIENVSKTINEIEDSYNVEIPTQASHIQSKTEEKISIDSKPQDSIIKDTKVSKNQDKNTLLLESLLHQISNNNNSGNNDLYIEQLKSTIDDLKKDNNEDKQEYKDRINNLESTIDSLQDELKHESRKVERSFFISDRFEKTLNKQNELMLNIINLTKNLWDGWELALWDIKKLISWYWVHEKILIDEQTSDVKLINQTDNNFYEKLQSIDDSIIIEKSRKAEVEEKDNKLNTLEKSIKRKNMVIFSVFSIVLIYGGFVIINYLLNI